MTGVPGRWRHGMVAIALIALVALIALPLLSYSFGGASAGAPGVASSIPPQYPSDDPNSQLVAAGHVVDSEGQPVAGVVLYADLYPAPYMAGCTTACQMVPLDAVVSAADGSFSVHLKPNPVILAETNPNAGVAEIMFGPRISDFQFTMGNFSLQVEGDHFTAPALSRSSSTPSTPTRRSPPRPTPCPRRPGRAPGPARIGSPSE